MADMQERTWREIALFHNTGYDFDVLRTIAEPLTRNRHGRRRHRS